MNTAHQEVERLLAQIRVVSNSPVIERASDQIIVLCRAYMETDQASTGTKYGLTKSRAAMLDLLIRRRGQTVSRGALMDAGYHNTEDGPETKIVDVHICIIRKALKGTEYDGAIEAVYGVGYRLSAIASGFPRRRHRPSCCGLSYSKPVLNPAGHQ